MPTVDHLNGATYWADVSSDEDSPVLNTGHKSLNDGSTQASADSDDDGGLLQTDSDHGRKSPTNGSTQATADSDDDGRPLHMTQSVDVGCKITANLAALDREACAQNEAVVVRNTFLDLVNLDQQDELAEMAARRSQSCPARFDSGMAYAGTGRTSTPSSSGDNVEIATARASPEEASGKQKSSRRKNGQHKKARDRSPRRARAASSAVSQPERAADEGEGVTRADRSPPARVEPRLRSEAAPQASVPAERPRSIGAGLMERIRRLMFVVSVQSAVEHLFAAKHRSSEACESEPVKQFAEDDHRASASSQQSCVRKNGGKKVSKPAKTKCKETPTCDDVRRTDFFGALKATMERQRRRGWFGLSCVALLAVVLYGRCNTRTIKPEPAPAQPAPAPPAPKAAKGCFAGKPPSYINTTLGLHDEPVTDSILPSITLYAPCFLETYVRVAKHYTVSARSWHFVKTQSSKKLVLRFRGEEPLTMARKLGSLSHVEEFLRDNILPRVGQLTDFTSTFYGAFQEHENGLIVGLFEPESYTSAADDQHRPMLLDIADAWMHRYHVTFMNAREHRTWIASQFGVTSFPAVVMQKAYPGPSIVYTGPMSTERVRRFVREAHEGCLDYKPYNPARAFGRERELQCDAAPVLR